MGTLPSLEYISLAQNVLSGTLPSALGNITSLVVLFLNNNNFSGAIPQNLRSANKIILDLAANNFIYQNYSTWALSTDFTPSLILANLNDQQALAKVLQGFTMLEGNPPWDLATPLCLQSFGILCDQFGNIKSL